MRGMVIARCIRIIVGLLTVVAVLLPVAAGCGGSDEEANAPAEVGPQHVHGLGINPSDGSLYLATHTGLFHLRRGSDEIARVGDRLQDTMGFSVVGPDRFIGSGHPDLRDGLPPLLGLIESSDAGRSWTSVSLLGDADFHALRADGQRIVGYDASGGRLLTSRDGGRTWAASRPPDALSDVVVSPSDPATLVAASASGLIRSGDGGRTWSPVAGRGLVLAWPADGALYALAPDGAVSVSDDDGTSWTSVGELGGEPAAATAVSPTSLIVALHDGRLVSTDDGGRTWSAGAWL